MSKFLKEGMAEELERLFEGRPYVVMVYDAPSSKVPREPWRWRRNVSSWFRSTVATEDVGHVVDNIRDLASFDVVRGRTGR